MSQSPGTSNGTIAEPEIFLPRLTNPRQKIVSLDLNGDMG